MYVWLAQTQTSLTTCILILLQQLQLEDMVTLQAWPMNEFIKLLATLESLEEGGEGRRGYFHAEVYLAFCSCDGRANVSSKKCQARAAKDIFI